MGFYITVLFFVFSLNYCHPNEVQRNEVQRNQTKNDLFNEQALLVATPLSNKSNNSEKERVVVLETPFKVDFDKDTYRAIRLKNGMTVLLISTEEYTLDDGERNNETLKYRRFNQKKSACSLKVQDVGFFSDPRDIQGLATLIGNFDFFPSLSVHSYSIQTYIWVTSKIEHMVFMGSKKYPGENEFGEFIRKSGGSTEASTSYDYASFDFETHEEYLDEALDRFSQLFKAPLMSKESLLREREAIESEFASGKNNDARRRHQLLSSLGEVTHPSSTFKGGNLKTLKGNIDDEEFYRKAYEFRKRHYSAHRMHLCLQSKHSLDNLQVCASSKCC